MDVVAEQLAIKKFNHHMTHQHSQTYGHPRYGHNSLSDLLSCTIMSDEQSPIPFNLQPGFEIPPGFTLAHAGPDKLPVLIPYYMMPAIEEMLAVQKAHQQPAVANASAKVRKKLCALAFLITN